MNGDTDPDGDLCPSCGVEWLKHQGMINSCKSLQRAKSLMEELLTYARQPEYDRDIGVQEIYFDLIKQVEDFLK